MALSAAPAHGAYDDEEKKLQPRLAIELTASSRFFSVVSRVRIWTETNGTMRSLQESYRGPRWHGRTERGTFFFIPIPSKGKSTVPISMAI